MQFLLIYNPDFSPFDPDAVERAFRSIPEFTNLRIDEPIIALIECEYDEIDSRTIIRLNRDAKTISLTNTWGAALQATLMIQKAFGRPLRVINDTYSFDLTFADIATVEELEAAMDNSPPP